MADICSRELHDLRHEVRIQGQALYEFLESSNQSASSLGLNDVGTGAQFVSVECIKK